MTTTPLRGKATSAGPAQQPFSYPLRREFVEPDWTRLPGYKGVTQAEWESALWQRKHTVKNLKELKAALGPLLPDDLLASMERDQRERATMSILVPPQMLNTMDETDLWNDPRPPLHAARLRRPAHRMAQPPQGQPRQPPRGRDVGGGGPHPPLPDQGAGGDARHLPAVLRPLHAHGPGGQRRAPGRQKHSSTCPRRSATSRSSTTCASTPTVRDVVVSGGDIANLPIQALEPFVSALLDIPNIRDIRLASKGLMALPQHFLQDTVLAGAGAAGEEGGGARRGPGAAHARQPRAASSPRSWARPCASCSSMGFRDVRNQGVLLRGVNDTPKDLLELCFTLLDHAKILPYYFYMCDMIPNSEHWRLSRGRGAAAPARHHGLHARLRHAAHRV